MVRKPPLVVRVETWTKGFQALESTHTGDYHDRSFSAWLSRHVYWALHNERIVISTKMPEE
jgi:hypothetical protein